MDKADAVYRAGERRLRELLPWARAESRKGDNSLDVKSALGGAAVTYVTEDNLDAFLIYEGPRGGWHADIVLKSVPPGLPDTFGTKVEAPCRTRAEAEATGKDILVSLLATAAKNSAEPPAKAEPVFILNGWKFPLFSEPLVIGRAMGLDDYGTKLQAYARVERVLDELCPEGFDGHAFNKWPLDKQAQLLAVLSIATLSGLFVYPMRQDAPPSSAPDEPVDQATGTAPSASP